MFVSDRTSLRKKSSFHAISSSSPHPCVILHGSLILPALLHSHERQLSFVSDCCRIKSQALTKADIFLAAQINFFQQKKNCNFKFSHLPLYCLCAINLVSQRWEIVKKEENKIDCVFFPLNAHICCMSYFFALIMQSLCSLSSVLIVQTVLVVLT